ncbi:MAG: ABC transporter permease [Chloroflexi bacterium]|nr:ABC transporter permease [Chloroflexota bacterium]
MSQYIVKRLFLMIPTLFGISLLIFSLIRIIPGDAATMLMSETPSLDKRSEELLRAELGLNRPYHEAYLVWLGGLAQGDLGESLWTGRPVREQLASKVPVSLELALLAMAMTIAVGVPAGVLSVLRPNSLLEYLVRFLTVGALSMPDFWIGTLLLVIPSVLWSYAPPVAYAAPWDDPLGNLQIMAFPALALGMRYSASVMRFTRTGMLEVIQQDYIRTARAKGLRESTVVVRHALKNAMIPVVTILGAQFSRLLGGTVVIETLFVLPGVGRATVDAITHRDYPQLQANVLFLALVFLLANLVVDLAYARLDPRIRLQ